MTLDERLQIERAVAKRYAGNADFIVAGIVALILAAFVVGVAVGSMAWWVP